MIVIGIILTSFTAGLAVGWTVEEVIDDEGDVMDVTRDPYSVVIDPSNFVAVVDNPYFPLLPGTRLVYDSQILDPAEHDEVVVMNETRVVMGVSCTVVRDTVSVDGVKIEETFDWYAQDIHGNVWYMGEDSTTYDNGAAVSKAGSWEGGIDGALPGLIMLANPSSGITYRQEYKAGEAEDMGTVISLHESVTVPSGTFSDCVKTKDWSPLEPGDVSYKYYAPGIGLVMETYLDNSERNELVEYSPV